MHFIYCILAIWLLLSIIKYFWFNRYEEFFIYCLLVNDSPIWGPIKILSFVFLFIVGIIINPIFNYMDSQYMFITKDNVNFNLSIDLHTITDSRNNKYEIQDDTVVLYKGSYLCNIKRYHDIIVLKNKNIFFVSSNQVAKYGTIEDSLYILMTKQPSKNGEKLFTKIKNFTDSLTLLKDNYQKKIDSMILIQNKYQAQIDKNNGYYKRLIYKVK